MKNDLYHIAFRLPERKDAESVKQLIEASPSLDVNSLYCYLLLCTHFAETSVLAEDAQGLCGFISAYPLPDRNDTLFVWQIVVRKDCRGKGIARAMLFSLIGRSYPTPLRYLETTVNPSNISSKALFSSFAGALNAPLEQSLLFSADDFGSEEHEDELLYRIGPFDLLRKEKF